MDWQVRPARLEDQDDILRLYRRVARAPGFLARSEQEIDLRFVVQLLHQSLSDGLILALQSPTVPGLLGLIHAERGRPLSLRHVLGHLTILIAPPLQGQGAGRYLFTSFLAEVATHHQDILRVELRARASNEKALHLYTSLGFESEGRFSRRIQNANGEYEDGIPMVWMNPNWRPTAPPPPPSPDI